MKSTVGAGHQFIDLRPAAFLRKPSSP